MPARLSAPNAPAATDNTSPRADGRRPDQLRPIRFQNHIAPYASGSTLIEWGDTIREPKLQGSATPVVVVFHAVKPGRLWRANPMNLQNLENPMNLENLENHS